VKNLAFARAIDILLVEDNPADVRLTIESLEEGKVRSNLHVVQDGAEALAFLQKEGKYADKPYPDLILLDLNLPKKNGHEVLAEIKGNDELKRIPVVVFSASKAEEDIHRSYSLHANCYIIKPIDLDQFIHVLRTIKDFWFTIVKLPLSKTDER
jgi:CheY-like chemotaxis protein